MNGDHSDRGLAIVTGASAGLGEEFARQLARRGHRLLLVARRADRLETLCDELRAGGHAARSLAKDLATETGREALWSTVDEMGEAPALLVNNAGCGVNELAWEIDDARTRGMLGLNVDAVTLLSIEAARRMLRAKRGGIINVASTAAFQAVPFMAVYGASKGYNLLFTEALNEELIGTGVRAFAFCPGYILTEFQAVAGLKHAPPSTFTATPAEAVRRGLDAFDAGGASYIDGAPNAALNFVQRFLPRSFVTKASGRMMRK
jgi:short-subunit dehydrogenase